ncbi:anti-sigma factor antagonist [Streptomyces sp. SID5785]|uniref:STAS domain-containing protein n=1 Tax=Streptomyces sp. SID5785 TaxID=2690309 RepID=UPI0013615F1C|nr:STAS domain-containing protein [Streptomyces sp. SID5785]MZD05232.1 anti-sigma factor antagonist [Streptomyces sp. SID5785]
MTSLPHLCTACPHADLTHDPHDGRTVVRIRGEVDIATAPEIQHLLDRATGGDRPRVLLDLRAVDFMDCSGLRLLVRADRRTRERGGELRLFYHQPALRKLFRVSGLAERFRPALPLEQRP